MNVHASRVCVLSVACVLVGSCGTSSGTDPTPQAPSATPFAVTWASVDRDAHLQFSAYAVGGPASLAEVSAPLEGRVVQIFVSPGDSVHAGDPLVALNSSAYTGAQVTLQTGAEQRQALTGRLEQLQALQAQGLARAGDVAALQVELARARRDEQSAAAVLNTTRGAADARRGIGAGRGLIVRSPISGTVANIDVSLGVYVSTAQRVAKIVQPSAQRLRATVAFAPAANAEGTATATRLAGSPDHAVAIRVLTTTPDLENNGGASAFTTFLVARDATAAERRGAFTFGVRYAVELNAGPQVYCVPDSALLLDDGPPHVFGRSDSHGSPVRLDVETVAQHGSHVCVSNVGPQAIPTQVVATPEQLTTANRR